jgi:hypothetical protein
MKMFHIEVTTPLPTMIYAVSKTQAWSLLRDNYATVVEATSLQIAAHARAGKTILGEPDAGDPRQEPLTGI